MELTVALVTMSQFAINCGFVYNERILNKFWFWLDLTVVLVGMKKIAINCGSGRSK